MNTAAKGRRNENKTKKYLEELGFIVHSTTRSSHRGDNDIFNLFDHVAVCSNIHGVEIEEEESGTELLLKKHLKSIYYGSTLYVQTTSNRNKPKKVRQAITEFPATHKQIFIWFDRVEEPKIINL